MRCFIPLVFRLLALLAALPTLSAVGFDQLTKTWTGLDKTNFRGQLMEVTLAFREAGSDGQHAGLAPGRNREAIDWSAFEGVPVVGTYVSQHAVAPRRGQLPPPNSEAIDGHYFPDTGILRFRRAAGPWSSGSYMLGVIDQANGRMAVVHTGMARKSLPFVLEAGDAVPEAQRDIAGFNDEPSASPFGMAGVVRPSREEILAAQQAQIAATQKMMEITRPLQQEMLEATRSGDRARVAELQRQLQALSLALQQGRYEDIESGRAVASAQSGCPEELVDWLQEMDRQGASSENFNGLIEIANLFRPSVFTPHFGKPFGDLERTERQRISLNLMQTCARDGGPFSRGSVVTSLPGPFADGLQSSRAEMGLAGLALDTVADWKRGAVEALKSPGPSAAVDQFERQALDILAALWPSEREEIMDTILLAKSSRAAVEIEALLEDLAEQARNGDVRALLELGRLPEGELFGKLDAAARARVDRQHADACSSALQPLLRAAEARFSASSGSLALLEESALWWRQNSSALEPFSDQEAFQAFCRRIGSARSAAFAKGRAEIESQIKATRTNGEVDRVVARYASGLDSRYASDVGWLEQGAEQQRRSLERQAFLVRVGEGPFGPDYPGAVYLNAIWRGDAARIAEEDRRFAEPFVANMRTLADTGVNHVMALFSGGMVSAEGLDEYMMATAEAASLALPLAGFFLVSYEKLYPGCMDANPARFEYTVEWETVVKNGYGAELYSYPSGSSTTYFNINRRHADAFRLLGGDGAGDPASAQFLEMFLPSNSGALKLSDVLRGMKRAMQELPCDGPEMRRIEKRLLTMVFERKAKEREIGRKLLDSGR